MRYQITGDDGTLEAFLEFVGKTLTETLNIEKQNVPGHVPHPRFQCVFSESDEPQATAMQIDGLSVICMTKGLLEFVTAENASPSPGILDSGIRHIAFSVDDLEAARTQLKSAGIEFESLPIGLPGMRLHFFRDLEGNYLHLVCRVKPLLRSRVERNKTW